MKRLLITDLDNTLYDWVTFYATAFASMADALVGVLHVPRDRLLDEFKVVHQRYGNSEQPFAALELPSVQNAFPGASREELVHRLRTPFDAFNSSRSATLKLYNGVAETLHELRAAGVKIVGHTEAISVNAWYRLRFLGVSEVLSRLYALDGNLLPHPVPGREHEHAYPSELVRIVPRSERKPNPRLLLDICERERVAPIDACYVGDSLTRDVPMAKQAGVTAVWARYGLSYDPTLWELLVRITHWTEEDVVREAQLKANAANARPDHTIDRFAEIKGLVLDESRDRP